MTDKMSAVDIDAKIPNNVDLAGDQRLQRALESWQPKFIDWWREHGPGRLPGQGRLPAHGDLRRPGGLGQLRPRRRCPTTAGGSSWPSPSRIAASPSVTTPAKPVWQEVPGEYRAELRRLLVVQGDTEPASVEQQRQLCLTAPSLVRPAQPVPGQRRGGPAPLGDGVPPAPLLRSRRARRGRRDARTPLRRRRPAAHPRRVQRADAGLAVVLLLHLLHRPRRQVPARLAARVGVRSAVADVRLHAEGGGAPHVRRAPPASAASSSGPSS